VAAWPVVIVDDEVDHAIIIRRVLADVAPDAPVDVMTDARRIDVRLLQVPQGALLLMDRLLDGRESVSLLPALLEQRPDVSVAILSAALIEADRDRALRAGAIAAAEKPASLDGWRALLRDLLTRHEAHRVA
jgi:DNA-binding NtrC family response regulator